jgi:hypothetical protein
MINTTVPVLYNFTYRYDMFFFFQELNTSFFLLSGSIYTACVVTFIIYMPIKLNISHG